MRNIRSACLYAAHNIARWRHDWRIIVFAAVIAIFSYYDMHDLGRLAGRYGATVSIWAVTTCFTPGYMVEMYVLMLGLIFSNAPFYRSSSQFEIVRSGRLAWILGQIIYIMAASLIAVLFVWVTSWAAMLPNLSFSADWGQVERTLAVGASLPADFILHVYFPSAVIEFSPIAVAGYSLLLAWLVGVFVGTMFMFFNKLIGKTASLSVFGFLMFMRFTSMSSGILTFGMYVSYFSPLNFCNIFASSFFSGNPLLPSMGYCIAVPAVLSVLFCVLSVILFCRQDLNNGEDEGL